jgi:Protein of unknown function (DUF1404)/Cytochrome c oxidase caa3 assembly factor (Caa3_CtaG)
MIVFGTLVATSIQPDLLAATEKDLASHMVLEHTLFFMLGGISVQVAETVLRIIVSSANNKERRKQSHTTDKESKNDMRLKVISVWSRLLRKIFSVNNRYGFIWLIIPIILLTFWHLPFVFDYAALNDGVHILQHISFIIVGVTSFLAFRALGESFKIIILISLNGIMAFAGLMFAVTTTPIYPIYSVSSHNDAGTYMLITCLLLLLVVLPTYLIHRAILHLRIRTTSSDKTV